MEQGYLIDSNAVIDFFNSRLPSVGKQLLLNIDPLISIITYIEIFSSNNISEAELTKLDAFSKIATIYNIDTPIAKETINLRLKYKVKLPDAIIAATALHYKLKLITRNIADFEKIEGLTVINHYSL